MLPYGFKMAIGRFTFSSYHVVSFSSFPDNFCCKPISWRIG